MPEKFDMYTFVAGAALKDGTTFHIRCNCGGRAPITPPLATDFVICPDCGTSIKFLVMEGDPGYVVGQAPDGEPMLIPVQGTKAKPPTPEQRARAIEEIKKKFSKKKK